MLIVSDLRIGGFGTPDPFMDINGFINGGRPKYLQVLGWSSLRNMAMEKATMNEDVSPFKKNGDFPLPSEFLRSCHLAILFAILKKKWWFSMTRGLSLPGSQAQSICQYSTHRVAPKVQAKDFVSLCPCRCRTDEAATGGWMGWILVYQKETLSFQLPPPLK